MRILYGPINSWRFGRSLGVDPLAARHKLCPFSCIYCQYGETPSPTLRRRAFVTPAALRAELAGTVELSAGEAAADCVTFAGLGEPTLASNLPALVAATRERLALPILVLTGGALFPDPRVRQDLLPFDQVVVTLNAPNQALFCQINRPTRAYPYSLSAVVEAISQFRTDYTKQLVLHVMLVQANKHAAPQLAELARRISPDEVQLNTPLQPALGKPLSATEMSRAACAFDGLPVRSVYEDGQARILPRAM
jgi:wyosine [tRNA(Phe)-imidazoG37] synthetase (radical SAM superfamily)